MLHVVLQRQAEDEVQVMVDGETFKATLTKGSIYQVPPCAGGGDTEAVKYLLNIPDNNSPSISLKLNFSNNNSL